MDAAEPSLTLVVLSDLTPGAVPRVREVDKDSLDEFLRSAGPSVELSAGGARAVLSFQDFKDFRPERLVTRLPAAADLLDFRAKVTELANGGGSLDAVRAALLKLGAYPELARSLDQALAPAAPAAPAPAPKPAAAVPEGGLFDMIDTGPVEDAPTPEETKRSLDRMIGEFLGGSSDKPAPSALRKVAAKAEEALAPLLREVLHDAHFQELESAWRGLRFLVRSIDFRAGARLRVIPSSQADLPKTLRDLAYPLADDLRSQGKHALLALDYTVDGIDPLVTSIAQEAAPRSLPVLAFAGVMAAAREMAGMMNDPGQAVWMALRSNPSARWLALTVNRFLLRVPYGKDGDPARGLAFEEGADDLLWGRAVWLLAALISASVARTGWGVDFAGREGAALPEPLPMRPGAEASTPLESDLDEAAVNALAAAGLLPLACRRGNDHVFAAATATLFRGTKDDPATTLRYAMFAAPIAATVESLIGRLDTTASMESIAQTIGAALNLMGMTEKGPVYTAAATPSEGRPAVAVRIRPSGGVLRGLPELAFEIPIALR